MLVSRDEAKRAIYIVPDRDLVTAKSQAMGRELQSCCWQGMERLVLDLARVRTIDNVGIETIIAACNRVYEGGGELIIENATRDLKDLFWLIQYDRRLTISRTGWPGQDNPSGGSSARRIGAVH